jgi:hypothetical protein
MFSGILASRLRDWLVNRDKMFSGILVSRLRDWLMNRDKMFSGILANRLRGWLVNHKALSVFQVGVVKVKGTTDNIYVTETTIDKYLR